MYKFPIRIPEGWSVHVSQGFASTELSAWYKNRGINMPEHNGVDITCGDGPHTYGTACVWPFPWSGTVYDALVDAPVGAKQHAHAQIDTVDPQTGISYSVIYLHLSAVTRSKDPASNETITYNQGDIVGYIGNNGAVFPEPTPADPFGGSHLHLGLSVKNPGESNGTMVDPLLYFNPMDPFRGPDDPSRDKPVLDWAGSQFTFNMNMGIGAKNDDVAHLQARLKVSPQTGYFGPITRSAVIAYQEANGITPTGYVGPLTRAVLNKN